MQVGLFALSSCSLEVRIGPRVEAYGTKKVQVILTFFSLLF
jgi:hypothetical protein